jgi:ubiquinone biosynthesis monooxygenase Coq7
LLAAATVIDPTLRGDLRSDHAGETGAVMIYRGVLAGSRNPRVREFAAAHLVTEQRHLDIIEQLLPPGERSLLLPLWRVAGWLTGCLPAIVGARAVFATIEAVETFVDQHYEDQVRKLPGTGMAGSLRTVLLSCQADEVHHRDEARELRGAPCGLALRVWTSIVSLGSRAAVVAARRIPWARHSPCESEPTVQVREEPQRTDHQELDVPQK